MASRSRRGTRSADEEGFTLIELLIAISILPIVIGGVTVAIVAVLSQEPALSSRIGQSNDALIVSTNFEHDVQSAAQVTTDPSIVACGTVSGGAAQLLGLEWNAGTSSQVSVSYVAVPTGKGTSLTDQLFRRSCDSGGKVTSARLLAADVPTSQTAAVVTCATTVTSCKPSTGWVAAAGISSVSLGVSAPGASGSYLYSLYATPQEWSPSSGGAFSGGAAITPFILLPSSSGTCSNAPGQNAPVVISGAARVISGSGSAPITDGCPQSGSIQLSGSGSVSASEVLSANCPNPDSITSGGNPAGPTETCTKVSNPLAPLAALTPTNPSASPSSGCTLSNGTYLCATGEYSTSPSLPNTATIQFGTGAAGSVFIFDQLVTVHNAQHVVFEPGTYWFRGGLVLTGNTQTTMDLGTYMFGTLSTPGATDTITVNSGATLSTGPGGALLYLEGGSASFAGGGSTSVLGESQYYGVAIWDGVNSGSSVTISNGASTTATFGGIYVPYGETIVNGNGQVAVSFVATETGDFANSGTLTLG